MSRGWLAAPPGPFTTIKNPATQSQEVGVAGFYLHIHVLHEAEYAFYNAQNTYVVSVNWVHGVILRL